MENEEEFYSGGEYTIVPETQINRIKIGRKESDMIKELIADRYDYSFPRYCEKVGIKPSNFYAIMNGSRACSLEFLNKLLSGVGYQVVASTTLTLRRLEAGEAAIDANLAEPDSELPFDEWGDMEV